MPTYTEAEKLARKGTIKSYNYMQTRDRVLGIQPTPPGRVIHHPRAFNPSPWCRAGMHRNWETTTLMGIPILKCKNCGKFVMKGSYEGTETKREIKTRHVPKPQPLPLRFKVEE